MDMYVYVTNIPLEIDGAEGCNPYRAPPAVFDLPSGHQIVVFNFLDLYHKSQDSSERP